MKAPQARSIRWDDVQSRGADWDNAVNVFQNLDGYGSPTRLHCVIWTKRCNVRISIRDEKFPDRLFKQQMLGSELWAIGNENDTRTENFIYRMSKSRSTIEQLRGHLVNEQRELTQADFQGIVAKYESEISAVHSNFEYSKIKRDFPQLEDMTLSGWANLELAIKNLVTRLNRLILPVRAV